MLSLGTSLKIKIAKTLLFFVKVLYKNTKRTIKRNGINFEVDLEEGIDLHLFLFGNFQKHVYSNPLISLNEDAVIFDIGGNIGVMSLFFAKKSPNGYIYAFEPTNYALKKFHKNLELNTDLAERIEINQCFIHSSVKEKTNLQAFSSWKLTGNETRHCVHKGIAKPSDNVPSITLDSFIKKKGITKIDLIKIDTDGYELEVLKGGIYLLKTLRPKIIFEIGLYIMKEKQISFADYLSLFSEVEYNIRNTNGSEINNDNHKQFIPKNGTVDLIALPN